MSTAPSKPPIPDKPDYHRNALNGLAMASSVTYACIEEFDEPARIWSARYYLINPNGTPEQNYLGGGSGTTVNIAKEYAAVHAYARLVILIAGWTTPAS